MNIRDVKPEDTEIFSQKLQYYQKIYEFYLRDWGEKPFNILEIGVKNGKSLRLWKSVFPKANIFGLDVNPNCKQNEEERITIEIGDQSKKESFDQFGDVKFDIIIDDGSHVAEHLMQSFNFLWKDRLNPGGLYFMEDVSMVFRKNFLGYKQNLDKFEAFMNKIFRSLNLDLFSTPIMKRKLEENPRHRATHKHSIARKIKTLIGVDSRDFVNDFVFLHFYDNLIVLQKKTALDRTSHEEFNL